MRLALKFGYDGRRFHGFGRQPAQRTVEGDIMEALRGLRILAAGAQPRAIGYGAASRTDAGVSAIGNVLALDTDFRKDALLRALNARLEDIWFHSLAGVPDGFQPKHARMRWYRYHLMYDDSADFSAFKKALSLFAGEHDFTNFCRPEGRPAVRSIRKVAMRKTGQFIALDFFSQGFLWNQVRRMVGAALGVSRGELSLAGVRRALDRPKTKADLGLAPAEPLILMDIAYDFHFTEDAGAMELARRQVVKKRKEAEQTFILASYLIR
ncbi:MAG: tRNA pseudouridine(38-40) synthase TruA [Euryarchaeota archaeon]|nr:tRNA pseudouridine(38-40) synthase TruA [Euryarchaeota archaeon]